MGLYTTPATYTVGELLTAALMNAISANFNGITQYNTSLPSSPSDADTCILTDSTSAPTYAWQLRYSSVAAAWICVGGSPLYAEVVTSESTASATYAALATAGPSVTVPRAGDYIVDQGMLAIGSGSNTGPAFMSYDIGGTGAVDADAVLLAYSSGGTLAYSHVMRRRKKTGLAAATALVSKYRNSGVSVAYSNRWISIMPVKVT